jgi:hypothetical protein
LTGTASQDFEIQSVPTKPLGEQYFTKQFTK